MGALWSLLGGFLAVIIGIILLIKWWLLFLKALAASIPILLILGGSIAVFIGFTELRDSLKSKGENDLCETKHESETVEAELEENEADNESNKKPKATSKKE